MNPRTPKRRRAVKEPQEAPFLVLAMGLIVGIFIGVAGDRILTGDGNVNCSRLSETVGMPKVQGLQIQPTRLESAHPTNLIGSSIVENPPSQRRLAGFNAVPTADQSKTGPEPGKSSCKVGKVAASDGAKAEPSRAHLISNPERLNPGKGLGAFGEMQRDRGITP